MPVKPSDAETEYFARQEFERRRQLERARQAEQAQREREQLKQLHFMKCPKCGMDLVEIDYRDLKVDKCTGCEGVWLDPGELEAIAGFDQGGLQYLRRD